jgi:hypothetical protein
MPFRCEHCQTLSATEEINCQCKHLQRIIRVEVVHFMVANGPGRPINRHKVINKGEGVESVESVVLNLGCDSTAPSPIATGHLPAVTCLKCLANYPLTHNPIPIVEEPTEQTLDDYLSEVEATL